MHNVQLFKRTAQGWVERPTGGRHLIPVPDRVTAWLNSDFAQSLLNNSVSATKSAVTSNPSRPTP